MSKRPYTKTAKSEAAASAIEEFIAALPTEPIATGHALTGMVKPSPNADGLLVAHFGDCRHWALIPAGALESIRQNGQVRCGAHTHTVADIQLKPPAGDLELGYSALADLHLAKLNMLSTGIGGTGHACPPGQHWGPDSSGNWGCQVGS